MARSSGLELAGRRRCHLTSRGEGREGIYLSDVDRLALLEAFGQVCKRPNWGCAYLELDLIWRIIPCGESAYAYI